MNGKNIVYVIEDYSENGGVEHIVSEKANILSTQYHHNVTLISVYRDERQARYKLDKSVRIIHLDVPFAKRTSNPVSRLFSRLITMFTAIRRLNKAVRQLNPDIIFFTTTLGAILLPFCHTKARKIYESHLARTFNPFNRLFCLTERSAERIVCLTSEDAREFKNARQVDIIPNFIYNVSTHVADYGTKKAIAVGRLEHQKGFDILIDCWKDIAIDHPDWHLDIYGDGSCREALHQQIDTLHLEGKVTLCGRNDNIMEVYPRYSLHLMTSRYEGLPMTLIEAQAYGLPSVVFNFQYGASDIITNRINGIIVNQGDTEAFIKATHEMIDNEALRRQMGDQAKENAKRFYQENIMPKWLRLIRGCVEKGVKELSRMY